MISDLFESRPLLSNDVVGWLRDAGVTPASLASDAPRATDDSIEAALRNDVTRFCQSPRYLQQPRSITRDHLLGRLESMGYQTYVHTFTYGRMYEGQNVFGLKRGINSPDEYVMTSAHYDSVRASHGADDNASGVAGALAVAKILAEKEHPRSTIIAFWDLEESGMLGSNAFAEQAQAASLNVTHNFVLEMIGFTSPEEALPKSGPLLAGRMLLNWIFPAGIRLLQHHGGHLGDALMLVGNAPVALCQLTSEASREGLAVCPLPVPAWMMPIAPKTPLWLSDHSSFWAHGFASTMVTDSAMFRNPNYHKASDRPETLDYEYSAAVVRSVAEAARVYLENSEGLAPVDFLIKSACEWTWFGLATGSVRRLALNFWPTKSRSGVRI